MTTALIAAAAGTPYLSASPATAGSRPLGPPPSAHAALMPAHGRGAPEPTAPVGRAQPVQGLSGSANLGYQGGYVMHSTATFAIYWHPAGTTTLETNYRPLMQRYLSDVGATANFDILSQYSDSGGPISNVSSFAGSFDDTATAYPRAGSPTSPLTDGDIQAEVDHAIAVEGGQWAASQPLGGLTNMFFVFLPKGVYLSAGGGTSFNTFCAYHSAFGADGSHIRIYAAMPYAGTSSSCTVPSTVASPTPNNDLDGDSEINLVSHELFEATSDPYPAGTGYAGWYFNDINHEIGDECNFTFGPTAPDHSDVSLHGHAYLVQTEWSNTDSTGSQGCVVTFPDHLDVAAPSSAAAGQPFSFTVSTRTFTGQPAPGYSGTVHFTSSDPSAALPADAPLTAGTGTFSATLRSPGTITATDTSLSTLSGTSAPVGLNGVVQHASGGAYRGASVTVTLPASPKVGDTLIAASLLEAGSQVALGWAPIGRWEVGREIGDLLTISEHVVAAGDPTTWTIGSTDATRNMTVVVCEVPGSGAVDSVSNGDLAPLSPRVIPFTAAAGDFLVGFYADTSTNDTLASVSGVGMSAPTVVASDGRATGRPAALGAFSASITSPSGQVSASSTVRDNNDGEVALIALK